MEKISKFRIIANILEKQNDVAKPFLYKKTNIDFKRKHGIDLIDAPYVFEKHDHLFCLMQIKYKCKYSGKIREDAKYLPIVGVKGKFKRLTRFDIKTNWDKK